MSFDSASFVEENDGEELTVTNLIRAVKCRPALWKVKHPLRNSTRETSKLWHDIQKKYPNNSVPKLKRKWKNVKDQFRREVRKYPQRKGQETGLFPKSAWVYFDKMFFLINELASKKPCVIFDEDPLLDTNKSTNVEVDSVEANPEVMVVNEETEDVPSLEPNLTANSKRKVSESSMKNDFFELENKKLLETNLDHNILRSFQNYDDYHFFMSLMPQMAKMTGMQKLIIRSKMMQVIIDESGTS